jgi:hypothetical protein
MSMEGDLRTKVIGDAAVSALVSTRMSPVTLPQDVVLPALSYQIIDTLHVESSRGSSGLAASRVQISAWSGDHSEVVELAEKVRLVLHGFSGTMGTTESVAILVNDGPRDLYEHETNMYRRDYDYQVHYRVTQP